jgi:acyl dehydratase
MSSPPALAALEPGAKARWSHTVSSDDVAAFTELSGDSNPVHHDDDLARERGFRGRIVHGMLLGAYVSRVLGTMLPGPGGVTLSQQLQFAGPVYVGDRIEVEVEVTHMSEGIGAAVLRTTIRNGRGETVVRGEAKSLAPPAQSG